MKDYYNKTAHKKKSKNSRHSYGVKHKKNSCNHNMDTINYGSVGFIAFLISYLYHFSFQISPI